MRLRQTKLICWATGVALLLGAVSVLAWALYTPCEITLAKDNSNKVVRRVSASDQTLKESSASTLENFKPLLAIRLRRPLFDPPPPVIKPPPKKKLPPLRVKLLLTMIDDNSKTAMFMTARGDTLFLQAGQKIGNSDMPAEILEIHSQHVILRYGDEKKTLTIDGGGS